MLKKTGWTSLPTKMIVFMPYYRQHGQPTYTRARPSASSTSSSNAQSTTTTTAPAPVSCCRFASNILCRFTFSLFLLIIALFIFDMSIDSDSNRKQGSTVVAGLLLIVALISFLRTCQTLRDYYFVMRTRRRLIQVGIEAADLRFIMLVIPRSTYSRDCENDNRRMTSPCQRTPMTLHSRSFTHAIDSGIDLCLSPAVWLSMEMLIYLPTKNYFRLVWTTIRLSMIRRPPTMILLKRSFLLLHLLRLCPVLIH